jgi:glucose-6-phosphate-specific signal transduction histidine kinase
MPAMSETTGERPVTSTPVEAPRMVAVRRRSRRKRTQLTPVDWRRIAVLGVMLVAGVLLVADPKLKSSAGVLVHKVTGMTGALRLEVVVLGMCGLIWLYLTPGVEDRIVRMFKKTTEKKRRGGSGRGRRR